MTQETIRRLSNTGSDMTQKTKNNIREEYCESLRRSGYSNFDIEKFVTPGIVGYQRRAVRESEGGTPVHRLGVNIKLSTVRKKLTIKSDWFRKTSGEGWIIKYQPKRWGRRDLPSTNPIGCQVAPHVPQCLSQSHMGGP